MHALELVDATVSGRLHTISCKFNGGQIWHLLGPNGAGKTSLLQVLAGILPLDTGTALFNQRNLGDVNIAELANIRAYSQVHEYTEFAVSIKQLLRFYTNREDVPQEIEETFLLTQLGERSLNMLSGGQQQRFHIARSLARVWPAIQRGEALVLLDEPCAQLDINFQSKLMLLLDSLAKRGNIVVMSSHDINLSLAHSSHAVLINSSGQCVLGNKTDVLTCECLQQTFDHEFRQIEDKNSDQKYVVSA